MLLSVIEQCMSHLNTDMTFEDRVLWTVQIDCEDDALLIVSLVSFQVSEKLVDILVAEIE